MKKNFLFLSLRCLWAFVVGAIVLSAFSLIQKKALGLPFIFLPEAFVIPILFGGFSGLALQTSYLRLRKSQKELSELLDNIDDLVQVVDKEGRFLFVNKAWHNTLGYTAEELEHLTVFDLIKPEELGKCKTFFGQIFADRQEGTLRHDSIFLSKDGKEIFLEGRINCRYENDEPVATQTIFRDLTDQYNALKFQKVVATIFEKTKEGVAITDNMRRVTFINHAFSQLTGYTEKEILGKEVHHAFPDLDTLSFFSDEMKTALENEQYWRGELWTKNKKGDAYPIQVTINAIVNERNEADNFAYLFSDISERKESEIRLQHLASHDELTNLPNRERFYNYVTEKANHASKENEKFAILFLDLDGFKFINDQHGHHTGDILLKLIAQRLKNRIRPQDMAARFGGDEFVVYLNNINSLKEAKTAAREILRTLSSPFSLNGLTLSITASIGISLSATQKDLRHLLIEADKAMYEAKRQGKNRVYFIDREEPLKLTEDALP